VAKFALPVPFLFRWACRGGGPHEKPLPVSDTFRNPLGDASIVSLGFRHGPLLRHWPSGSRCPHGLREIVSSRAVHLSFPSYRADADRNFMATARMTERYHRRQTRPHGR